VSDETIEEFIEEIAGESYLRVEADLGGGFVRLKSDEAQRRQAIQDIRCVEDAIIELLRNSRDAHATQIFVSVSKEEINREITIIDNGCGVPRTMYDMIFEPRVTSKLDTASIDKWGVHGRGMALYSIRYNAKEAFVIDSVPSAGTCIKCIFDTTKLREKVDQSTFPQFKRGDDSTVNVSGPRNILRNTCEFALEHRNVLSVYLGSASEIAATLYDLGIKRIPLSQRCIEVDYDSIPVCDRLAYCADPTEFCSVAESIGLNLSSRTASRIMNGEIKKVISLSDTVRALLAQTLEELFEEEAPTEGKKEASQSRKSSPKISGKDLDAFKEQIAQAFHSLAEQYYLDADPVIALKKSSDSLTITIQLIEGDGSKNEA